ncbi:MAG: transcription termination/antitermination protein NusA [Candidatus Liptonbacteria bacterium]|nr:transcription termination/antitermination protein NusA [Candidatus Liptonbacteria bacterium]
MQPIAALLGKNDMFNLKDISKAIDQIADEKGLKKEAVLEAIESSIAAAYKKEYGKKGEIVKAKFNPESGELKFWQVKTVVDESTVRIMEEETEDVKHGTKDLEQAEKNERKSTLTNSTAQAGLTAQAGQSELAKKLNEEEKARQIARAEERGPAENEEELLPRYNEDRHLLFTEAKKIKKGVALGEELEFPLETHSDFGRIAAQTAKQVVLQKLREAEKNAVLSEFEDKEGQIVSGIVQRFERGNVYVDLGRAIGVMFDNETIPGEHYKSGERLRFYVLAVQNEPRLPSIILSRSHPQFVAKLFEMEVPEIADGVVQLKAIAREPGSRTKIAVHSDQDNIDPVGSCVGQRGTRVMAVNNELGQEKIDIIEWSEDPAKFVANSLSPARVTYTEVSPRREIKVYVPEDQLSLAIGRGGQNVRLAARLTGWKIDVRSQSRPEEVHAEGVAVAAPVAEAESEVNAESAQELKGDDKQLT